MRVNIEIDDALLAEAMAATGLRSQRKVVEAGLRLLARHKRQADARQLFGPSDGKAIFIESAWMSWTAPVAARSAWIGLSTHDAASGAARALRGGRRRVWPAARRRPSQM